MDLRQEQTPSPHIHQQSQARQEQGRHPAVAQEVGYIVGRGVSKKIKDRQDDPDQQGIHHRHRRQELQHFQREAGVARHQADEDGPDDKRQARTGDRPDGQLGLR